MTPLGHEEKVGSNEIVVNRSTLAMYQAWAVATTTALVTVLMAVLAFGRTVITRGDMEAYVRDHSPYAEQKSRIDEELDYIEKKLDQQETHITILDQRQNRVIQRLGMSQ